MASKSVLSLLFLSVAVCSAESSRIIGGEAASIEQYPSIVQVDFLNGFLWGQSCAANILTTRYVVSAAQCFDGILFSPSWRRIRAGSTLRNTGGTVIQITRVVNHPSFNRNTIENDISVVQLTSALVYGANIQPGPIVQHGTELPYNLPVVLAGWGQISTEGQASVILNDVQVFTINRQLCSERFLSAPTPRTVTDNMICAGVLDVGGRDACDGDTGGPVYYQGILVGIVSWGEGCATDFFPRVTTRVASYTEWIVETAV